MRQSRRASLILCTVASLASAVASPVSAQTTTGPAPPTRGQILPGISLGVGVATVGTEGTPWNAPLVASLRLELTRFLVAEVEWTQPMRARTFDEISSFGPSTLNNQTGVYGHSTRLDQHRLRIVNYSVMARSRMDRFSFFVGAGISRFQSSTDTVTTHTGCTGPWVVHCQSGNRNFRYERSADDFIVVGGFDFRLHPHVDLFVAGRIGGSNAGEEGVISAGVRAGVIPDRHRRGWTTRSPIQRSPLRDVRAGETIRLVYESGGEERGTLLGADATSVTVRTRSGVRVSPLTSLRTIDKEDSLLNGLIIGLIGGGALGLYIATFDEPRTLPAAMLGGAALGAFVDSLSWHPRAVYRRLSPIAAVSPSGARVGLNVTWK